MTYNVYPPAAGGAEKYGAYVALAQSSLPADLRGNVTVATAVDIPVGQYVVEQYGNASTSVTTVFGSTSLTGSWLGTSALFWNVPSAITRIRSTIPDNTVWATRTSASATNIFTILHGNGIYLHAGQGGTISTSTDAISWTTRSSGTTNSFKGSVYANGLYVLVGDNGQVSTSTDAISWTTRSTGFGTSWITGVAYGNGVFVAVGNMFPEGSSGAIVISTNGITWSTRVVDSAIATKSFSCVTFGDGLFVAGRSGGASEVYTSTNGLTWTTRTVNVAGDAIRQAAYGNGVYVVSDNAGPANVRTSTDTITWTTRSVGVQGIDKIYAGNNLLYIFGEAPSFADARVWVSTNGASWTQYFVPPLEANQNTGYAVNGIVISAGSQGRLATTTRTGNPYNQATIFSKVDLNQQIVE